MAGAYIVKKLKPDVFYPLAYGLGLIAAIKLLYDSLPSEKACREGHFAPHKSAC